MANYQSVGFLERQILRYYRTEMSTESGDVNLD